MPIPMTHRLRGEELAHIPEETWRCSRTAKVKEKSERDRKCKPSVQ